ncbi:hypothetical protein BDZ94DRAFT_1281733 [Collybia nuda]|uniref:RRM domain-containing protein n=1 Tax=Collybia nuda TaxID=64659 RepID=A0A9P6CLD9_9AGAR|nr:hypothetical protein BDZ94DRAFT_1281733 [Collybia nuda]
MYSSSISDSTIHILPEYATDHEARKFQPQHKPDRFPNNAYRSNFTLYPNANAPRSRHQNNPSVINSPIQYRDTSFYPTSSDIFPPQITSPVQPHGQAFDPRPSFDLGGPKSYVDMYNPSTNLHHHVTGNKSQHVQQGAYSAPYSNGLPLSSQTPYGPHVPAPSGPSTGNPSGTSAVVGQQAGISQSINAPVTSNPSVGAAGSEDISTIFVVGFPEDMQEREFQNMFTFSSGFEAATLKIPNKEYTSYNGVVGGSGGTSGLRGSYSGYVGPNDPYNLVTVNQGGIIIDTGRDGTMTSWPASVPGDDVNGSHFLGGALSGSGSAGASMPPRKQIIGFAKFKTREEALTARDVLQGRRVDIDKGAVLKAEMAKKNLHTKRGVGPVPGGTGTNANGTAGGSNSTNPHHGVSTQNSLANSASLDSYPVNNIDMLAVKERELGTLGAMGLMAPTRMSQWRDQIPQQQDHLHPPVGTGLLNGHTTPGREEEERRIGIISAMGLGGLGAGTRGPRERAEDDERERRRKEKESHRLRNGNSSAYDAFHSVPAGLPANAPPISRHVSNTSGVGMLSPVDNGYGTGLSPMMSNGYGLHSVPITQGQAYQFHPEEVGPWDSVRGQDSNRPRSSSQQSMSPSVVPVNAAPGSYPDSQLRSYSPSLEQQHQQHFQYLEQVQSEQYEQQLHDQRAIRRPHAHSESSSSSIAGESLSVAGRESEGGITDADLSRAMGGLEVDTDNGKNSPQLPSPASGASSRNGVDQNPPINTLYVGNLPNSPPPAGFPHDYLEESLRELFSSRAGFRRLCFRQKSNGPMCFVEFDDVPFATRALNDLYGNNLKGLVKGGIRLSYSKNPLGVRTPTSAGSNGPSLQQQQLQSNNNSSSNVSVNNTNPSYSFVSEFQPRFSEDQAPRAKMILRRDMVITSPPPQGAHGLPPSFPPNFLASPPPRFYTSSPSASTAFGATSASTPLTGTSNAYMPRSSGSMNLYGFNMSPTANTSTFSPFGLSNTPPPQSMIPDRQNPPDDHPSSHSQHLVHRTLSPPANLEAARAG